MLLVPGKLGVYKTEHMAALVPLADKVHWPHGSTHIVLGGTPGLKVPNPSDENVTLPVGLVAPDTAVSVTVAVQAVDWNTITGLGAHDTLVLVGSTVTVWVTVAP